MAAGATALLLFTLVVVPARAWPSAVDRIFASANFTTGLVRVRRGPSEVVASSEWGDASFTGAPISSQNHFPIGSNTKAFVATSLYQLQELGAVNLSDSIADYLTPDDLTSLGLPNTTYCPTVPGNATCQTVSFVQLLAMSAGIYGDVTGMIGFYRGSIAAELAQYLSAPLLFVPGTAFYYSNPSFMLGAWFVEKFSGMQFWQYVRANIIDRVPELREAVGDRRLYYDPYDGKLRHDPLRVQERYVYLAESNPKSGIFDEKLADGVCSTDLSSGAANGAGGFIGDIDTVSRWYFTIWNFTAVDIPGQTHPLFRDPKTLLEMVQPRTNAPGTNRWFAQGVWVIPAGPKLPGWSRPYPPLIFYEGETICSHTANFLDVSQSPPLLTQAWKAAIVYQLNASMYTAAVNTDDEMFFAEAGSWRTPEALHNLAWAAHDIFAPSIEFYTP